MSIFNDIEMKIKSLSPGAYQRLCSEYAYKKYNLTNMSDIGGKEGTDKTTIGVPDSYSRDENGKYLFFMYGTVESSPVAKVKSDIEDAHNSKKTGISIDKVDKIICFHTNTNMRISSKQKLINLYDDVIIELIDIDSMAHDIYNYYPFLAFDYLGISIDSNQISDVGKFIERYDKNNSQSPLNIPFIDRKENEQLESIFNNDDNNFVIVTGNPGVGKTKLALEVCNKYIKDNKDTKCYCIRNNGGDLYSDIKMYLSGANNYILFFDDINETSQLASILDYISIYSAGKIKVIATVREYALKHVENLIKKYVKNPKVLCISTLSKEELETLLNTIGIKNKELQKKIISISKNNPRIAIMCANALKNKKISSLSNVLDVFKSIYDCVIEDNELTELDIKILFYLAFFGPIRLDNKDIKQLLEELNILNIEEYKKLSNIELIDFFEEKALKINDQSFGNYILYKYLIDDKNISIYNLLKYSYPNLLKKFITCINNINKIFLSEDTIKYICDEIKKVWNENPYNEDLEFFESFYNVDRLKALAIIKKEVDEESEEELKEEFLIEKKLNEITNKKVSILTLFKDADYEQESIDLLLYYLGKKPSIFNETVQCLKNNFGININSIGRNFESEYMLMNAILSKISEAKNNKVLYEKLFISIVDDFLNLTHNFTSAGENMFTIEYSTITMKADDNYIKFRNFVLEKLLEIKNVNNSNSIYNILINYNVFPLDDSSKQILENDIKVLNKLFFSKIEEPTISESNILYLFNKRYKKANFSFEISLDNYSKNEEYMTILPFIKKEDNDEEIIKIINKYTTEDYSKLFSYLKKLECSEIHVNEWYIQKSLELIFDKKCNEEDFIEVFSKYIEKGYPFSMFAWFLQKIESLETLDKIKCILLDDGSFNSFWYLKEILDQERTKSKDNLKLVTNFIELQKSNDRIASLSIDTIIRYKEFDKSIIQKYSNDVIKYNVMIGSFISHHDDKDAKKLIEDFEDVNLFKTLYINGLSDSFDSLGFYGIELIKLDNKFFVNLIENIESFNYHSGKFSSLITNVWKLDNYEELIMDAYNEIISKPFGYLNLYYLFEKENNNIIKERQVVFLNHFIEENYEDLDKMHYVFSIINQYFSDNKKELVLKLINLNNKIEVFKKTVVSYTSESWSGSRIPLIEQKLEYVSSLANEIPNKITYIEHKSYLKELIEYYKLQIEEEKLCEYVDEFFR